MSPSVNGGWRTPLQVVMGPAVCHDCRITVWLEKDGTGKLVWRTEAGVRHRCRVKEAVA